MALSDMAEAYPLQWPVGWELVPVEARKTARFGSESGSLSIADALGRLSREMRLLGAHDMVVSSNVPTRRDGLPHGRSAEPYDGAVAVYFRLKGHPQVLACSKWNRVADNIAAVAAHVSAMRGQSRWGVGSIEQAFAGYRALAAVGARKPWWETLGMKIRPNDFESVHEKYLLLIDQHHPDKGGNANQAAEINAAFSEAKKEMGCT